MQCRKKKEPIKKCEVKLPLLLRIPPVFDSLSRTQRLPSDHQTQVLTSASHLPVQRPGSATHIFPPSVKWHRQLAPNVGHPHDYEKERSSSEAEHITFIVPAKQARDGQGSSGRPSTPAKHTCLRGALHGGGQVDFEVDFKRSDDSNLKRHF